MEQSQVIINARTLALLLVLAHAYAVMGGTVLWDRVEKEFVRVRVRG
jgi:hypothetical protein